MKFESGDFVGIVDLAMSSIWTRYREVRKMSRLARWNSPGMQPGTLVQAVGEADPRSTLVAPFSGRECVSYRVDLREWDDGTHCEFLTAVSVAPFYVRTQAGTVIFNPMHCVAHLSGRAEKGDTINDPSQLAAFFDVHAVAASEWKDGSRRSFRWKENILKSGDLVQVAGRLGRSIDNAGLSTYREPPSLPSISGPESVLVVKAA
tara:strand:- start:4217 stop:4831 length:615 start_codon:yes stop_codon:yes gene_type:complete